MSGAGTKLIFAALALLAGGLTWQATTNNRERRELVAESARLEAELLEKRGIARDLGPHQERLAKLEEELEEVRRRTTPDLDALSKKLAAIGATMKRGAGRPGRRELSLSGASSSTMSVALDELDRSGFAIDGLRIQAHERGWTADLVVHVYVEPSPPTAPPPVPEPWYGFLNDQVRERIQAQKKELEELDRAIGRISEQGALKKELEARRAMLETIPHDELDLLGLARRLFTGKQRVFLTGRLERAEAEPRGGLIGRLARPLEDRDVIALLGSGLDARVVRRFADTVEIAFQKREGTE